jgi:hypothetical protein
MSLVSHSEFWRTVGPSFCLNFPLTKCQRLLGGHVEEPRIGVAYENYGTGTSPPVDVALYKIAWRFSKLLRFSLYALNVVGLYLDRTPPFRAEAGSTEICGRKRILNWFMLSPWFRKRHAFAADPIRRRELCLYLIRSWRNQLANSIWLTTKL